MEMERAYGLLTITKADEERREISGVMSTGETDRAGDQVSPMGVEARLPAPCLWQHDALDPIGEIVWIDPKPDGIRFRAKLAKIDHPPSLKDKLDGYFALIKAGVVKGVSIGFRALEARPISTGVRFDRWELLEASVVTIPANASCTIQTVKAAFAASIRSAEAPPASPTSLRQMVAEARSKAVTETRASERFERAPPAMQLAIMAGNMNIATVEALVAHVEALELKLADSTTRYRGTWQAGERYVRGDLITDRGSIWFCSEPTTARPGDDFTAWRLACRKGRDGKDLR